MAKVESLARVDLAAEVDPTFAALRVVRLPIDDVGSDGRRHGSYRSYNTIGVVGSYAANALIAELRWQEPLRVLLLLRVFVNVIVQTVITAAQRLDPMTLTITRAFASGDSSNSSFRAFRGDSQKLRTVMGVSSMKVAGDVNENSCILEVNNIAGMSAGTRTDDANPIGVLPITSPLTALGQSVSGDLYRWDTLGGHPILLAAQEGLLVKWGGTAMASGNIAVEVGFEWMELPVRNF